MSAPEIARLLSRNILTIRVWLNRYIKDGVAGLRAIKASGRPAKKAEIIESQLQELLNKSPQEYGYQEAGWQINLLRDWFQKLCIYTKTALIGIFLVILSVYVRSAPKPGPKIAF